MQANHPLINAVLATNYEWGPLKSKELVEVLKKNNCEGEEMVIMPYPNFGNQSMAVNEAEEKNQENCVYITVNYMGFPHVFLLALQDIRRGEQLRTIIPKSNQYFQNRKSCDFRIPGLVRMLSEASGMVPLTEPAVQWEQQLCARASQIYFVMDTKVKKIRDEVEAAWTKAHVSQRANEADVPFEEKVEICNTSKWALDEGRVIEQLRSWLEPKEEEAGVRAAPPTTTCDGEQYAEEYQAQTKARKEVQDPCKPKKPASAYFVYLNGSGREQILAQEPALRVQDVAKVAGGIWSHMTPEERLPFEEEAARRLQQYKIDKAAYDQENLGGLGGGGVSAFESEMVEQLKVSCGANPNTWTSTSGKIKKQTLQHIATGPLWERWCGAGFDERKLTHFVHRLRSKYLEDQGVQCNISEGCWYSAKDNETPDQISKHSGVSLAALLRVNR